MKKFTAILLAVVMLFALSASAFAATNSLETDYAIGDGLGVSVDLDIEGMYFDGVDILNTATNGYYPFSFSLIASDRTKVASVTVSNGGSFHWAYAQNADGSYVTDEDGNYVESTTTNYGVVVLPTTSASTVTVTGTGNIGQLRTAQRRHDGSRCGALRLPSGSRAVRQRGRDERRLGRCV